MIEPVGRVSFDRAAEYYDRTRDLPPEALAGVVELLARELAGRGRCLEIGVGTGRIALPLAAAGQPMAGIDVSAAMLGRLVAKAGRHAPFPIVLADATLLPFRPDTFGGALCVHVLHLIRRWGEAVDELLRVVRPEGVILIDVGGAEDPSLRLLEDRFGAAAGIVAAERPGLSRSRIAELDDRLAAGGCTLRLLPPVAVVREERLADHIDRLEEGLYSWTWPVAEPARRSAAAETRAWAVTEFGPLDAARAVRSDIRYRAYDLPAYRRE
jgi:SAM-dependent methyltransferase